MTRPKACLSPQAHCVGTNPRNESCSGHNKPLEIDPSLALPALRTVVGNNLREMGTESLRP
jgi:hypothetical protein